MKAKHVYLNYMLQFKNSQPPDKTSYFYVNSLLYFYIPLFDVAGYIFFVR
jgi:hypothetical protein